MPNNVLYYSYILDLCEVAGDYTQKRALLYDIQHGDPTSPKSIIILAKYWDGDVNKLAAKYKELRNAASGAWVSVKELLEAEGRYVKEDAEVFGQQLCKVEEVCDFRKMVRTWARAELKREAAGKGSTFYDMRGFLDRYEALILKRRQKSS